MRLTPENMARVHRHEITPAEAFALQGDIDRSPGAGRRPPTMGCAQAQAAVEAIRSDIAANGPDALRELLAQTDALLERQTGWTKCQRAARYRAILSAHAAARNQLPVASGQLPVESTPATGHRAPATGFYDLVVPLGTGSTHNDLELRYLLRSALANLPVVSSQWSVVSGEDRAGAPLASSNNGPLTTDHGLRTIHLIGPRRPKWLRDHPMVRWHPWKPIRPKNHDIIAKFLYAADHPDVAEHFLASCDDFLFLRPLDVECSALGVERSATGYAALQRGGVLSSRLDQGYWKRAQAETRKLLEAAGKPVLFYDYHVPTLMTKAGWRRVDETIPWRDLPGHAVWSLYHNVAGTHGPVLGKEHNVSGGYHAGDGSRSPSSLDQIDREAEGKLFLNYNDGGLKGDALHTWLARRFPTPAPWEDGGQLPVAGGAGVSPASGAAGGQPALGPWSTSSAVALPVRTRHAVSLPKGAASAFPADLDILVVLFGRSLPRAAAVARTFARWHRHQQPMPRVLCAWCYADPAPGDLATLPNYPWLRRVHLPQYDLDDGVFRKEGLLNYLLRDHSTAPYILTLDADVWTPRPGWFRSIRDKLAEDPDHVLQPFRYFKDTKENVGAYSWSAQTLPNAAPKRCKHPGLGWAFTRAWVEKHGDQTVFNPWHVAGSGDCSFVLEHFRGKQRWSYASKYASFAYFQRVFRSALPEARLAGVESRVWHENHTDRQVVAEPFRARPLADRAYEWSRHALDPWGELSQYIVLDTYGVPTLRDPSGPFARQIRRKPEMQDRESMERVLRESLGIMPVSVPGLPQGCSGTLHTWPGIGDHLMLLGVVSRLHREHPGRPISVHLTRPGLEPWFRAVCPTIRFSAHCGDRLVWRHGRIPPGRHAVSRYGADPEDVFLPIVSQSSYVSTSSPRIAFVTETGGTHLHRKRWPHWERLAELVSERYGVTPFWIGTTTKSATIASLPQLLESMDVVIAVEGMASHLCWAIRRRAIVLLTGAIDPTALCYPGFHIILRGACRNGRFCNCYLTPGEPEPECAVDCMGSISAGTVLESLEARLVSLGSGY